MIVKHKESNAEWQVTLKVVERTAKAKKKKSNVFSYTAHSQTESLGTNILNGLRSAEAELKKWEELKEDVV